MFNKAEGWQNRFPRLKGKVSKIKSFIPAVLYAWGKVCDETDEGHQAVTLALKMNAKMDAVIDEYPGAIFLPRQAARELKAAAFLFLNQLNFLADMYNTAGDMLFDVTMKGHMLAHACIRAGDINPRRTWCFSGERAMLMVRQLGQSCCRGIRAPEIGKQLLTKYVCGLHMRLNSEVVFFNDGDLDDFLTGFDDIADFELPMGADGNEWTRDDLRKKDDLRKGCQLL